MWLLATAQQHCSTHTVIESVHRPQQVCELQHLPISVSTPLAKKKVQRHRLCATERMLNARTAMSVQWRPGARADQTHLICCCASPLTAGFAAARLRSRTSGPGHLSQQLEQKRLLTNATEASNAVREKRQTAAGKQHTVASTACNAALHTQQHGYGKLTMVVLSAIVAGLVALSCATALSLQNLRVLHEDAKRKSSSKSLDEEDLWLDLTDAATDDSDDESELERSDHLKPLRSPLRSGLTTMHSRRPQW